MLRRASLLLAAACACGGSEGQPPTAAFTGAWAEFLGADELRQTLPLLGERHVALHLAWDATADDAPLLALARDGAAAAVEVRPWLLLAEADGYWPGSTNAATFDAALRHLMDRWDEAALEPTALLVDMEMRFDRSSELQTLLTAEQPDIVAILELLIAGIDRAEYTSATATYVALIDDAHARGWRVLLTTLPQVLDDYEDGDDDIRQAFGIPIEGIAWDALTFQAYRTLFGDFLTSGSALGPWFVYDYAGRAVQRFGDRGGVDVGLVGAGVTPSSIYASPTDLQDDVSAALAANVAGARINVYNLDGMVARGPLESWLAPSENPPAPPPEDSGTSEVRGTSDALDDALDGKP